MIKKCIEYTITEPYTGCTVEEFLKSRGYSPPPGGISAQYGGQPYRKGTAGLYHTQAAARRGPKSSSYRRQSIPVHCTG